MLAICRLPIGRRAEEGGVRIIGEACHILDLFQYLVGAPVVEVSASAIESNAEHILASDNVSVTFSYKDGSVATLFYTALWSPEFRKEYMEPYSKGMVLVLDDYFTLRVEGSALKGWKASVQDKGHLEELRVFASSMRENGLSPIPLDDLAETSKTSIIVGGKIP